MNKAMRRQRKTIKQQVNQYKDWGFNPIHLFGRVYLIRRTSIYGKKRSLYVPIVIKPKTK